MKTLLAAIYFVIFSLLWVLVIPTLISFLMFGIISFFFGIFNILSMGEINFVLSGDGREITGFVSILTGVLSLIPLIQIYLDSWNEIVKWYKDLCQTK